MRGTLYVSKQIGAVAHEVDLLAFGMRGCADVGDAVEEHVPIRRGRIVTRKRLLLLVDATCLNYSKGWGPRRLCRQVG